MTSRIVAGMKVHDCEVCGDAVTWKVRCGCGHLAFLCTLCLQNCSGATRECLECENKGEYRKDGRP